jgi:modulator of FtsH protease HflK
MNPQDPNVPSPASAPPAEDASSQALAEAMRSSFVIVQIIMVGLVLVFLGSGFFTVGPQEQAIKLRLGKPVDGGRLFGPGAHWAWPPPIDEVVKFPITSLTNADSSVGWYQSSLDRARGVPPPAPASKLNPAVWTYALTADTNIIHVWAAAHYRISDPAVFIFNFSNAPAFITNALNNALLRVSSEFTVDGILTSNQAAFREQVEQQVRDLIQAEHLGVAMDVGSVVVDHSPPLSLEAKFAEVVQATQKRDILLQTAQSYTNITVAKARGEADTRVKVADAERKRKVEMMASQADVFTKLLAQYESDPELFKRIRQMNALQSVYTNVQEKIVEPPNSREYRFQFNREPRERPTNNIPTSP